MKVLVLFMFVFYGCAHTGRHSQKSFWRSAQNTVRLHTHAKDFYKNGGFSYHAYENERLYLSQDFSMIVDKYEPELKDKAPLVVILHGNKSFKEAHRKQAKALASWGFNVLNIQLPNRKQWIANGYRVKKLVDVLRKKRKLEHHYFDNDHIILVGHSFGGSAITLAAGSGADVSGLILLDPAVVHSKVKKSMKNVTAPAFLIGADKSIYKSKNRQEFFRSLGGGLTELSIRGATHNEAQYPTMTQLLAFGFDPAAERSNQKKFLSLTIVAAFDIAMGERSSYAKKVFSSAVKNNMAIDLKRRKNETFR